MAGFHAVGEGDLSRVFITDAEMVNRFQGQQLFTWGYNANGQLGDTTIGNKSSPIQTISGGNNWKQVGAGYQHTAAIKTDGTLWVWGYNVYGQLGTGNTTTYSSPIQTIAGGTNWKQVSVGNTHTAAIKTDGTLWMWGNGGAGRLGNSTSNQSSPIQTISGGTNWKQVSAGYDHTAAIKTDGTLWLWGNNLFGYLGTNNATSYSSPVQTIAGSTDWVTVSVNIYNSAAIKTDGTLWLWGYNLHGQLGTGNTTTYSSPVQTIAGGTDWKSVSFGDRYCAAIKTDGTLWLWGNNEYGQLGDNTIVSKSSPIQTISGGTNWRQVDCGSSGDQNSFAQRTAAIKTDGTLWTWGEGVFGHLGDNTTTDKSSPVQIVSAGVLWKQVSAGAYHTAAIKYQE